MNRTVLTGPTRESHRLSALFMEDHEKEVSELGQHKLPKRYAFADWFSIEGTLRKDGTLYTQGKKSEPHTSTVDVECDRSMLLM
ncbi:hypothetical protein SARC_14750 [Sphaeroforma arctica JP610]|uniref:Uncharacterized protein n=1 Tax=Sphaeroforma arctica JP610 TaxID=667725 RepID=A0A0L0F820_9EUKA|nr:hypothetical protein SARC_14750 [Sphaeroforma arctica JP610]KNC72691.1 hypothetical protein SARC_14750 [Sphaeroforma arctica JP610]|eukprot:XP_014146593.1 hypothetical protein SARC_14750 [Sphaeroforma arctica JP610]